MRHKTRLALLITAIICALLAATVLLWLRGCFLPAWISWEERTFAARLIPESETGLYPAGTNPSSGENGLSSAQADPTSQETGSASSEADQASPESGLPYSETGPASPETDPASPEKVDLRKRKITVTDDSGTVLFSSPSSWKVSDVLTCDLDHNGGEELIMLVWKRGSYGTSKPFWVKHDDPGFSQHIFIYTWSGPEGRIRPLWMSSDVGMEIRNWELVPDQKPGDELPESVPEQASESVVESAPEQASESVVESAPEQAAESVAGTSTGNTQSGNENKLLRLTDDKGRKTYWRWENWGLKLAGSKDKKENNSLVDTSEDNSPNDTRQGKSGSPVLSEVPDPEIPDSEAAGPEMSDTKMSDPEISDLNENAAGLTLLVTGDNIIHPSICAEYTKGDGYDFTPIYENLKPWISSHDIAVAGQETPLVSDPSLYSGYPDFGTPQAAGDALAEAGFDVILGASNHALDKGLRGLEDTCDFWQKKHPEVTLLGIRGGQAFQTGDTRSGAEYSSEADSKADFESISEIGSGGDPEAASKAGPKTSSEIESRAVSELSSNSRNDCIIEKNGIRLALFNYTTNLNGHRPPKGSEDCVNYLPVSDVPEVREESINHPSVSGALEDSIKSMNHLSDTANLKGSGNESSGHSSSEFFNSEEEALLVKNLHEAENIADISLVFLHTGTEYAAEPDPETRDLAVRLIEGGADAVFCSHPHVVQPYEEIRTESGHKGVVFYSLGNFVANQDRPETILGAAVSMKISLGQGKSQTNTAADAESRNYPDDTVSDAESENFQADTVSDAESEDFHAGTVSDAESEDFHAGTVSDVESEKNGQTSAAITEYEVLPLVCHFGLGKTRLYFLKDYTNELAAGHYVSRQGDVLTLDDLNDMWDRLTSHKDSIQK